MPKAPSTKTPGKIAQPARIAQSGRIAHVDTYIAKAAPFAQPVLEYLRDIVHEASPNIEEAMKWSMPFFDYKGILLANMAGFKQHCSFGLFGKEIAAVLREDGTSTSEGMGKFGKITAISDLPSRKQLLSYVRAAVKAIDDGVRTKSYERPKKAPKPEVVVPDALLAALKKNKVAATKFEAMTPSCRREYSEWIADAKRDETRNKRVETALEWITEGKHRNWKYGA